MRELLEASVSLTGVDFVVGFVCQNIYKLKIIILAFISGFNKTQHYHWPLLVAGIVSFIT